MSDGYGRNPRKLRILNPNVAAKAVAAVPGPESDGEDAVGAAEGAGPGGRRPRKWNQPHSSPPPQVNPKRLNGLDDSQECSEIPTISTGTSRETMVSLKGSGDRR